MIWCKRYRKYDEIISLDHSSLDFYGMLMKCVHILNMHDGVNHFKREIFNKFE